MKIQPVPIKYTEHGGAYIHPYPTADFTVTLEIVDSTTPEGMAHYYTFTIEEAEELGKEFLRCVKILRQRLNDVNQH